jgi:hypothetical protein
VYYLLAEHEKVVYTIAKYLVAGEEKYMLYRGAEFIRMFDGEGARLQGLKFAETIL